MNDLLINAQGQYYINTNMKFLSLSVILKRRFIDMSKSLQDQLQQCQTNKCLTKVQKKLQMFEKKKQQIQTYMANVRTKMEYDYLLCNDMIYENDIRICRKQAKEKWLKEMAYFINNTNLPNLKKTVNTLN